jgi:hypothetical protein
MSKLSLVAFLISFIVSSSPQEPIDIFAEGVKVTPVYVDVGVIFDNAARLIRYTTRTTQREYPYPDEMQEVVKAMVEDETSGLITLRVKAADARELLYTLNIETGAFQLYLTVCTNLPPITMGEYSVPVPNLQNIDQWTYLQKGNKWVLCHIGTGKQYDLPELGENASWGLIFTSPNRTYLLLTVSDSEASINNSYLILTFRYYAYDIAANSITLIDSYRPVQLYSFERWLTETQVVISDGYMGMSFTISHYQIDLTKPGSLREIFIEGEYVDGYYLSAMTRGVYIRRWNGSSNCTLSFYETATEKAGNFTLAQDCGGIIRLTDGSYLYLAFDDRVIKTSTLYHLTPENNRRTMLLQGEFEVLLSISPDMRYVALLQDDNGKVDRADIDDFQFFNPSILSNPQVVIIDLKTQAVVYQVSSEYIRFRGYWEWDRQNDEIIPPWSNDFADATGMGAEVFPLWIDAQTVMLIQSDGAYIAKDVLLVNIDEGFEIALDSVIGISDDGHRILTGVPDEDFYAEINLYDRVTNRIHQIADVRGLDFPSSITFHGFQPDKSFDLCLTHQVRHSRTEKLCYNVSID